MKAVANLLACCNVERRGPELIFDVQVGPWQAAAGRGEEEEKEGKELEGFSQSEARIVSWTN